ncbi:MAG TPA: response regulator [Thermoanaerobaculia bacterium]|jgi:CheY-like chemotaxis protein|nr:response regulator [Thermoanaerobaculia bacterium]
MNTTRPVILVVDDDGPILLLMRNLLREFGFDAVVASSGAAALDSARAQPPQLALLDLHMPGMSGPEVVQALRAEPGLEQLPILILSGEPLAPAELQAIGANGSVLKPFDVNELVEQIRSAIGATA